MRINIFWWRRAKPDTGLTLDPNRKRSPDIFGRNEMTASQWDAGTRQCAEAEIGYQRMLSDCDAIKIAGGIPLLRKVKVKEPGPYELYYLEAYDSLLTPEYNQPTTML